MKLTFLVALWPFASWQWQTRSPLLHKQKKKGYVSVCWKHCNHKHKSNHLYAPLRKNEAMNSEIDWEIIAFICMPYSRGHLLKEGSMWRSDRENQGLRSSDPSAVHLPALSMRGTFIWRSVEADSTSQESTVKEQRKCGRFWRTEGACKMYGNV